MNTEIFAVTSGILLLITGLYCIIKINNDADDDDNSITDLLTDHYT